MDQEMTLILAKKEINLDAKSRIESLLQAAVKLEGKNESVSKLHYIRITFSINLFRSFHVLYP